MGKLRTVLIALLGCLFLSGASPAPERRFYVEVPLRGLGDIQLAQQYNLDVGGVDWDRKVLSLVVHESRMRNFPRDFKILGRREIQTPDKNYKQYSYVQAFLKDVEKKYPQIAKVYVIGKSVEGKEIYAIHLTEQATRSMKKESVLFDAMHHAREVMTPEVALDIVHYLTAGVTRDRRVRDWLKSYNIWVVPMVNPDGNGRVWSSEPMWRKNTRGGYGVDINRNYPYDWGTCNGSSGSKNSETYRGDQAGSEPETQALLKLAALIQPKFNISYHSYSELVIYPFGCNPKRVPKDDAAVYYRVGKELAGKLVRDGGSGTYREGTSYDLLYNVDGGSIDQMYTAFRTMSFVIEVNSASLGFQPPFSWRDPTVLRQRAGWQYILEQMDKPGLPSRP
jgi:carboxypeptidase T